MTDPDEMYDLGEGFEPIVEPDEMLERQREAQQWAADDDALDEQDDVDDAELAEEREKDAWYDAHHQYPSDYSEERADYHRGLGL